MRVLRLGLLFLLCALALPAQSGTTAFITPGAWAICDVVPFLCFGGFQSASEEWIAVVLSDAGTDVVAFNLDVVGTDGVTRTFLIRRNTEAPERTMTSIKLGRLSVRSTTVTLLKVGPSFTATQ